MTKIFRRNILRKFASLPKKKSQAKNFPAKNHTYNNSLPKNS
jgi:hypothetical protein